MNSKDYQLIEKYVSGILQESERSELELLLRENAEARACLRTLATLEVGLGEFSDAHDPPAESLEMIDTFLRNSNQGDPKVSADVSAEKNWKTRSLLALTAMVCVCLLVALFVQRGHYENRLVNETKALSPTDSTDKNEQFVAKISAIGGAVIWTGDGGRVTRDLAVGSKLTGGTIEGVNPTSWVELEFLDGTALTLSGDSRLTFSDFGQKILYLKEGEISSKVKPQPKQSPMLVHTRNAILEVVGTEFDVESEIDSTTLNVTQGMVRLKRLSDGEFVEVPANQRALASSGLDLSAQPIPEIIMHWKSDLNQPDHVFGRWISTSKNMPSRLKTVPHRHTTGQGQKVMLMIGGVTVLGQDNEQVVFQNDSKIRVRGFCKDPQQVVFGISVKKSDGGFGGSYSSHKLNDPEFWMDLSKAIKDQPKNEKAGELKEFEIVVNAAQFNLSVDLNQNDFPKSPTGMVVESFYCVTPLEKIGMEITEVEIFRD